MPVFSALAIAMHMEFGTCLYCRAKDGNWYPNAVADDRLPGRVEPSEWTCRSAVHVPELTVQCRWNAHEVPTAYLVGERDVGMSIASMVKIIAAMPEQVPNLKSSQVTPKPGDWLQQESHDVVNKIIIDFLRSL